MPAKKKSRWTVEDEAVFAALGVGEGELSLRNFISGQRKINGRLYEAMELILDAFPKEHSKDSRPDYRKLAQAQKITDAVPGSAPGCGVGGLSGNPTTRSPWKWKL